MVVRLCVALLIFIASHSAKASEIDSFSPRYAGLSSQMDTLNTFTREILADVVQEANGGWFGPRGCNARRLSQKIWWAFWSHQGQFRRSLQKTARSRSSKPPSTNLFTALVPLDSPVLGGWGRLGIRWGPS